MASLDLEVTLQVATGDALSVRRFVVREAVSELFEITVVARSTNVNIDLDAVAGWPASVQVKGGVAGALQKERRWSGLCCFAAQEQAEPTGLSTYRFVIVPTLYRLTRRRGYRILQHCSAPDAAAAVLDGWSIPRTFAVDGATYPKLPYKVQYAETDYAFFCRLLEEAGMSFTLQEDDRGVTVVVLDDRLHAQTPRPPIAWVSSPSDVAEQELVTELRLDHANRHGAYTLRDHDMRRPAYRLFAEAERTPPPEASLEHYEYRPGAFLVETTPSGDTPHADDRGAARHELREGERRAQRSLGGARADKRVVTYRTNVLDLWPGRVFSVLDHPHPDLEAGRPLLATAMTMEGVPGESLTIRGRAVLADTPYRPPLRTPRTRARMQCATVSGPIREEVHTDEFGRVRVRFPWDRDAGDGCWIRVSQLWAGAGYGMMMLPRVGQEVLVDFLEGDPEQPVVVGRLFNATCAVPEPLPERETRSLLKSNSSPGGGGFNELLFEDKKGSELYYEQAQRDRRALVKHDDTSTVVRDRNKVVGDDELETTSNDRTQETKRDRVELVGGDRTTAVDATRRDRVDHDAKERLLAEQVVGVGGDRHVLVAGVQRALVARDGHYFIGGQRPESVGGTDSLTVGKALQESVGSYTVTTGPPHGWIHHVAAEPNGIILIESDGEVTAKSPAGFIKIDGGGVTIVGTEVVINEGGSPGDLPYPGPRLPEPPKIPIVEEPIWKPRTEPLDIIFDDPFFGPAARMQVDLSFSDGARETRTTDATGTITIEPGRGRWVDTSYDRQGLVVKGRVYLELPDPSTDDGAWQRLVNMGYTWTEEASAPTQVDLFRAAQDFQARHNIFPTGALDGETRARIASAHDDKTEWRRRDWGEPAQPTLEDQNLKGSLT